MSILICITDYYSDLSLEITPHKSTRLSLLSPYSRLVGNCKISTNGAMCPISTSISEHKLLFLADADKIVEPSWICTKASQYEKGCAL